MLEYFFKKRRTITDDTIVSAVVTQTADLIHHLQQQMDLRFNELNAQIREVELSVASLETKLLTKDLKDKQAYGLLHYKLHESKNAKLDEEISNLESQLLKKRPSKDQ